MPQSILAILAMMIASLFAMQVQRHTLSSQMDMIRNELELQSTGLAEDVLGEIGATNYDENTKGGEITDPSELTPESGFASGDTGSDDIDDFHGCCVKARHRTSPNDTLSFEVETSISYADPDDVDAEVNTPTKVKKATVKVTNLDVPNAKTITLSRSFACGSKCNW